MWGAPVLPEERTIYEKIRTTAHHTVYFGIAQVLQSAIGFLLIPVYVHFLQPSEYGVQAFMLMVGGLLLLFPNSVLVPPIFRSYYDYTDEDRRAVVISTGFWLTTAFALAMGMVGWFLAHSISRFLAPQNPGAYVGIFRIVTVTSVLNCLALPALVVFRARLWSRRFAAIAIVGALITGVSILYMVAVLKMGLLGLALGDLAGSLFRTVLLLAIIAPRLRPVFSRTEARKMLDYGLPLLPYPGISYVNESSDRFFLKSFAGLESVGVYNLGWRFAWIVNALVYGPFLWIQPAAIFSAEKDADAREFYAKILTYLVFMGTFVGLGVSGLSREVIRLIGSEHKEYWGAWKLVPFLSLAFVLGGIRDAISPGLLLRRRTQFISLAEGVGTVVIVSLMFVTVRQWQGIGAVLALLIGRMVTLSVRLFFGQKSVHVPYEWGRIAMILGVAAGLFLATLPLSMQNNWLSMAVKLPVLGSFPLVLYLLGFYQPAEVRRMWHVVQRTLSRVGLGPTTDASA